MPAHATLFHALPEGSEGEVLAGLAAGGEAGFPVAVTGLMKLGRGVAFTLAGDELLRRRATLAARFAGRLTRQDAQNWRPHVTVQNKVEPARARALHTALLAGFAPWDTRAAAFGVWRYRGGPWEHVATVELR